jgi:hypothetical protein
MAMKLMVCDDVGTFLQSTPEHQGFFVNSVWKLLQLTLLLKMEQALAVLLRADDDGSETCPTGL